MTQLKFIPALGVSDFKEIVTPNLLTGDKSQYFDKTLMIKDIISDPSKFILFTRPRRFGKTLNMSMLKYFFGSNEDIFSDLKINDYPDVMKKFHNKIPTIFLSLKDVTGTSYDQMLSQMSFAITCVYNDFNSELNEDLSKYSKDILLSEDELIKSLRKLSQRLYEKYGQQVLILLDEYDTPLNNAYVKDFLGRTVDLLRSFFAQSFKDNPFLYKGIMTGINRIAKENIFSGLNNFKTADIDSKRYAKYFGFTDDEIESLQLPKNKEQEIKKWYNGYNFGSEIIYNPWSILYYLDSDLKPGDYWSNTGGMSLIEKHISLDLVSDLNQLLKGNSLEVKINKGLVYLDLDENKDSFFSLLYNAGYLTASSDWLNYDFKKLRITNKEILRSLENLYIRWFTNRKETNFLHQLVENFAKGNIKSLQYDLQNTVLQTLSFNDVTENKQESFYHGFLLGISLAARDNFNIKSNHESGYGRYDIAWYPKNKKKNPGILIELKVDDSSADDALQQIDTKKYEADLVQHGCTKIMKYGIHCDGKNIKIKMKGE